MCIPYLAPYSGPILVVQHSLYIWVSRSLRRVGTSFYSHSIKFFKVLLRYFISLYFILSPSLCSSLRENYSTFIQCKLELVCPYSPPPIIFMQSLTLRILENLGLIVSFFGTDLTKSRCGNGNKYNYVTIPRGALHF